MEKSTASTADELFAAGNGENLTQAVYITKIRAAIATADAEMARLKKELIRIQGGRDYNAVLLGHVVREAIPDELLSNIFQLCIPLEYRRGDTYKCGLSRVPMRLSQICPRWRNVAISTGALWSHIGPMLYIDRVSPDLVSVWLSRSSGCPLSISIRALYDLDLNEPSCRTLKLLTQCSHRWRVAHIDIPIRMCTLLEPIRNRIPLLQSLEIHLWSRASFDQDEADIHLFRDAPRLEEVTLASINNGCSIPWSQILCLNLHYESDVGSCLQSMRDMPSLLHIYIEGQLPYSDLGINHVTSKLQTLSVGGHPDGDTEGLSTFLQHLTLPDLRVAAFRLRPNHAWSNTDFIALAKRSHFQLHTLALRSIMLLSDELHACLRELPHLKELEIGRVSYNNVPCVNNAMLDELTWRTDNKESTPPLLPKLETLKLLVPDHEELDDEKLADWVQSRRTDCPANASLIRFVSLQYQRDWDEDAICRMQELQSEGLALYVARCISAYKLNPPDSDYVWTTSDIDSSFEFWS